MNKPVITKTVQSVCPHDCPSVCAINVDILENGHIGRVRGRTDQTYTAGVVCAKVARYEERIHHPNRLLKGKRRKGAKGEGHWQDISFDDGLDEIAEKFLQAEARHGPETVWPYFFAGTMGHVQRDGIDRLRHAKGYSGMYATFCTNMAWTGYVAGTGRLNGVDPREMVESDLIIIWGTNPVYTQVNVMTHVMKARKKRGAKLVAIDIYNNPTVQQADLGLVVRPGTDGALAAALMHILFRDGTADRAYMARYTDASPAFEEHLRDKTPEWAAAITGLTVADIETLGRMIGETDRTFFRLGYGFTRQRNGTVAMHAAASIAAVRGSWQYEGGGVFHNNAAIYHLNKRMITAHDLVDPATRVLDQSQIGRVLTGDREALCDGPPVTALMVQNSNPASVAPEQAKTLEGLAREDLFTFVHEQFMTETAEMADIVLPATMFLEHDDIYTGGGHTYLSFGGKALDAPGDCRPNHAVFKGLAERMGLDHPGFFMSEREHIDWMLLQSGWGGIGAIEETGFIDCKKSYEESHFLNGFGHKDGRFHFAPDWRAVTENIFKARLMGPHEDLPQFPDHWDVTENADEVHPFALSTSPARNFLNSSFNGTRTSLAKEERPTAFIHPDDAAELGIDNADVIELGNERGTTRVHAKVYDGIQPKTIIVEGIWANRFHISGTGINQLIGADQVAPAGGAAFHDARIWVKKISDSLN